MKKYIGCDAHKKYSIFVGLGETGSKSPPVRVNHNRQELRDYLEKLPKGSPIAVETIGSWYWMVDEMEKAGHKPYLTHAGKAKKMMGKLNKTDKLDAEGLALLLKNETLPSVWIPPAELRDQRELPRTRMVISRIRTRLKNRIHATLAKYNIKVEEVSDLFGKRGRELLRERLDELPPQTKATAERELALLDETERHVVELEKCIKEVVKGTDEMRLLTTLHGVGFILSVVITLEIGSVDRFPGPSHLASYAGLVPSVKQSGARTFYGSTRPDVNHYLKWAFVEAANVVVLHKERLARSHAIALYERIRSRKGHAKAIVAVARHLAEATYWMLKKNEAYNDPVRKKNCFVRPRVSARARMSS